jgi:hypothetical protein
VSVQQTVKIRVEFGPGMPIELKGFDYGDAFAATLKALFQILTSDRVYPGPEAALTATYGKATVRVEHIKFDIGASDGVPSVHHTQCEAKVTLQPDEAEGGGK